MHYLIPACSGFHTNRNFTLEEPVKVVNNTDATPEEVAVGA